MLRRHSTKKLSSLVMTNAAKVLPAIAVVLFAVGCKSDSTPASPIARAPTHQEREAIVRALPGFIRDIPVECVRLDVGVSHNPRHAMVGLEFLNALRRHSRCLRYASDGFFVLRKTNRWKIVYNGSVAPPCSSEIPRDLFPRSMDPCPRR